MLQEAIESFLSERIGLESKSLPRRSLNRIVKQRMDACGIMDEGAYLNLVTSSWQEFEELVEALVVPETWFFRDSEPFVFLKKYVIEEMLPSIQCRPLRILSAPGSTGEEPYSIAMTLMDVGLSRGEFAIDSLDISRKAVAKAIQATYGSHSFREKDEEFRSKYFRKEKGNYQVIPEVREVVNFVCGNLLDWNRMGLKGPYDIIFFRNLLIYFNDKARKEAARIIDGLLRDNGLLFLGYAEAQRLSFPDYVVVNHPRCFAVRKTIKPHVNDQAQTPGKEPRVPSRKSSTVEERPRKFSIPAMKSRLSMKELEQSSDLVQKDVSSGFGVAPVPKGREVGTKELLERARRLADAGRLDEATSCCRELIETDAAFADAYSLLGVIALAQGDEDLALDNFNKVVYLEPGHPDALFHLSLLMDKRGLTDQAQRYRERLHRASATGV